MVKSASFQRIVQAAISVATIGVAVFGTWVSCQVRGDDAPATGRKQSAAPFAGRRAGQTRNDNGLKTKLVWIPPGDFTMGSPKDEKDRFYTEDQVQVSLSKGFWLGQHEVTQSEWRPVMHTTPWSGQDYVKEGDNYPATYVSWDDAMKFCEKLTDQEHNAGRLPAGWKYTLPTEAQWEYACRAGTKSRFSFNDDDSNLVGCAWSDKNAYRAGEKYAHQVAQKKPNPWGLSDMHGNVWEWCRDWYKKELLGGTDPQGPSGGSDRVNRGGGWLNSAKFCRSAFRGWDAPGRRFNDLGFRVAAVPSGR
jgi:formylglycine-generating enzyme required for sulfatase activity